MQLPRAGLRRRRRGALRGRQEVRHQLARRTSRRSSSWSTASSRAPRPEGRDDVHGGGVAPLLREPAGRRSCATGRTPTRSARRPPKSRASSTSCRSPSSRAAARPASSAATTRSSRSTPKNPGGALKWIDYITRQGAPEAPAAGLLAVPDAEGDLRRRRGPEGSTRSPTELREAISQAKSRPVSPVYPQVSQAIYKNVNAALSGKVTPEKALETAQSEMDKALATF